MASHSSQRSRKPQAHPSNQVPMHNLPPRENSPSPTFRDRPRTLKAQSMPLVPSVMQMFGNQTQQQPQGQQPNPTAANTSHPSRRSPQPPTSQVPPPAARLLPSPPQPQSNPNPGPNPNPQDPGSDRRMSPPHPSNIPQPPQHQHTQSQPNVNAHPTHYPRPINRGPPPQFLNSYGMDQNWQMTDELLAEIERADKQQAQVQGQGQGQGQGQPHPSVVAASYAAGYPHVEPAPGTQLKDAAVERVRTNERASPKDIDSGQQRRQREQQISRESPKGRDRPQQPQQPQQPPQQPPPQQHPTSPTSSSFGQAQAQSHTPEPRISPQYHTPLSSPGEHTAGYTQYKRESPPVLRRPGNPPNPESRPQASVPSQTPPTQAIQARTPDRSLPVQEEPEDDVAVASKNGGGRDRDQWKAAELGIHPESDHVSRMVSPTPSSDIHPEGPRYDVSRMHGGRDSRAGHRADDDDTLIEQEAEQRRSRDRERADEEDAFTPRSPTAGLPDNPPDRYFPQDSTPRQPARSKTRNGATDQLGLRGFDPAAFSQGGAVMSMGDPPQYVEQRKPVQSSQYQHQYFHDGRSSADPQANLGYYPPQMHPDDIQSFMDDPSSYYHYLQSPRPNAPIPPTPHSGSAAPSPSPLVSGRFGETGAKELPPFSPVPPVGSPYPYPFSHVRRNISSQPNRPPPSNYDPNHPSVIQEQYARQWQIYAQNNQGHISDSTFSPSSTPFQGAGYNPWAYLHTNRTLGRIHDPTSLQSSPSHEPVPLPPPPMVGLKKKDRSINLRTKGSIRKPPPRVESTQPRETSPEPSSSGEETAGEERYVVHEEGNWVNRSAPDDNADWVDEDDEPDDEDLLDLEYHPTFVSNVEKRRRRWETRWEALNQAFQALDRQTDATLVLLAAPSHSTKLHSITSRSIRRQPALRNSQAMAGLRSAFRHVAAQRRNTRSQKSSLVDRLMMPSSSSTDSSDASSESREEDLKRALGAALGSLGALGGIYEQREARWAEEMRRISDDRERVELLLRQALGDGHSTGNSTGRGF